MTPLPGLTVALAIALFLFPDTSIGFILTAKFYPLYEYICLLLLHNQDSAAFQH